MKKLVITLTLVVLGATPLLAQSSTSTRQRTVATPTPIPPVLGNDTRPIEQGAPPVLRGGNRPQPLPTVTPTADGENEIIKVETNLVTMPVSVLDHDGRFISGLQQGDFKIFENGVEQKIDYFQSVEQPFTVVLLIDVSPSTQFAIHEIQNAAITFVNQLRQNDRVMVIAFDERVHVLSPPTNNRYQLRDAIRRTAFGDGTSLYEAVDHVIERELRQIQGRKAVVLFTDGVDTTSRRATYDSTLRATEEIDALFYPVRYDTSRDMGVNTYPGPRTRGGRVTMADVLGAILAGGSINMGGGGRGGRFPGAPGSNEYARGKQYLETLAQNSGGRAFEAQSMYNLDAAFQGIAEELRRQYSLGYYPEKVGQVGERKQIRIRVMRQGVVVRAKNSYIVGQSDRGLAGR